MYNTSPAYSIAGKYKTIDKQIKPNPLTYHHQNWNPKKTPSWKIGKDIKCKHDINQNPGPGQYQTIKPQRSNKFGIIGKQNERQKINIQKSPSPASYSPKFIEKGTSVSFAKKYQLTNSNIYKPGPGSYERTITLNTIGSAIGKEKRFIEEKEPKFIPGPGAYEYKRPSSAKVSFGKEMRDCGRKLMTTQEPGPGQYEKKSIFENSIKSCKGFSLGVKTIIKDLQKKPGPGNYDPDFRKIYSSNPSFSIPRKYKPVNPDSIPAPNAYEIKVSHQSLYTPFNKQKRQPFLNNKDIPGPGCYQPEKIMKSSPKFSLGMSRKGDLKQDFPGPGAYEANKNIIKSRPQSAKIGKSARCSYKRQLSPGPGEYQKVRIPRPTTPSHSFGKDQRMKQRIVTSPGPGQYSIPSAVGYVAPYGYN